MYNYLLMRNAGCVCGGGVGGCESGARGSPVCSDPYSPGSLGSVPGAPSFP